MQPEEGVAWACHTLPARLCPDLKQHQEDSSFLSSGIWWTLRYDLSSRALGVTWPFPSRTGHSSAAPNPAQGWENSLSTHTGQLCSLESPFFGPPDIHHPGLPAMTSALHLKPLRSATLLPHSQPWDKLH